MTSGISAAIVALYATGASLRDVGRKFGITKSKAYGILKVHAPRLLDARNVGRKKELDHDAVRRLTAAGMTRQQIADELGFGYDAVRESQIRLGLHKSRGIKRNVPEPVAADAYEPPFKAQLAEWPADIRFEDARVRASIGFGRPSGQATTSECGCAAAMCEVA